MLKPFQIEEKGRMRTLESTGVNDMTFQKTFGWLGSCRGMGGKMVTMASYLNERVRPLRVEDRAWTHLRSSVAFPGAPSAVLQTSHTMSFNPYNYPDLSYDAYGNERQTTLIVVTSETTFEMDRWRTAMDEWTSCRTVCFKTLTDMKKIFPARQRPTLNADSFTSERFALELVRAGIEVVIVSVSCLDRYKKLFGEIAWTRIVLNDGLTDHLIWGVFQGLSHELFPCRFLWLIEALSDDQYEDRLVDVGRLAGLTHRQRFTRRNWLESLCAANVLQSLVVRTNDLTIQASVNIVKHLDVRVFADTFRDMQTKTYEDEERIMNASIWMQLSDASIRLLTDSGRHIEILHKAGGPGFVRDIHHVPDEEISQDCPVCLCATPCTLGPCGHAMCPGCCAGLYMRNLERGICCPLCRTGVAYIQVGKGMEESEAVVQVNRKREIKREIKREMTASSLASNVRTCIDDILEENGTNRVLLLCVPLQYQQVIETSIAHTPLNYTLYGHPSREDRVYYANSRLFMWSMFRRVPFELKDVTHVVIVQDRTQNTERRDCNLELIDMLRVWSLGRTTHDLHYILFEPEPTT